MASDFPSVTYPWLVARERFGTAVKWVDDDPGQDLTAALLDGIHSGTTGVCFSAVQFATGSLVDVGEVVRRAHAVGARVIVDVTQMAGAMAVSLRSWSADALVCSGYKWLSTHGGVALLVAADELLQAVPPIVGWKGTQHPFQFDPTTLALATDARRFELSTIAYSSAAGLSTSIELLTGVGFPALTRHAEALARELVAAMAPHGWTPFRDLDAPGASHHIVSLRHPTLSAPAIQARLLKSIRSWSAREGRHPRVPSRLQRQLRHRRACRRHGQDRTIVASVRMALASRTTLSPARLTSPPVRLTEPLVGRYVTRRPQLSALNRSGEARQDAAEAIVAGGNRGRGGGCGGSSDHRAGAQQ